MDPGRPQLRRYSPADALACCSLINQAIQDMAGLNEPARALIVARNVPDVLGPDLERCFTLVAVAGDGVCGVGALDGPEIKRLYVLPDRQREGIGALLVQGLQDQARRAGLASVQLHASPSSVAFYQRQGFQRLSDTTVNGPAEFHHIRMWKALAPD